MSAVLSIQCLVNLALLPLCWCHEFWFHLLLQPLLILFPPCSFWTWKRVLAVASRFGSNVCRCVVVPPGPLFSFQQHPLGPDSHSSSMNSVSHDESYPWASPLSSQPPHESRLDNEESGDTSKMNSNLLDSCLWVSALDAPLCTFCHFYLPLCPCSVAL